MRLIRSFDIIGLCILAALLLSCSRFEMENPDKITENPSVMRFSASYPLVQTRATESGFVDGDQMGVFVVDYDAGQPGVLHSKGNRADNTRFTYNEASMIWNGTTDIYWKDKKTPVDIYGYYPFDPDLSSVGDYKFSVLARQDAVSTDSELGGYEASDLLWAKSGNIHPTTEKITLTYSHLMAGITVVLQMGDGFNAIEWSSFSKTVLIKNTVLDASVDLSTGYVLPAMETPVKSIVPFFYSDEYRAVVVPQMVEAGRELLNVTVDGQSYSYSRQDVMTYHPGKMHTFTIKVDRKESCGNYYFEVVGESVSNWKDESDFYEGIVREYIVVNVSEPGNLKNEILAKGLTPENIPSIKINGNLNHSDLSFIGKEMSATLRALNMKNVKIVGNAEEEDVLSFGTSHYRGVYFEVLSHLVFPEKIKKIGDYAFSKAALMGSLVIPEGVEEIGVEAFAFCPMTGTLQLPSSLKILRGGAFAHTKLRGNLTLPDQLEIIGPKFYGAQNYDVFKGCDFEGKLNLPRTLTMYEGLGLSGMTGDIVVPQGVTEIFESVHKNSRCTSLTLPEGILSIGKDAFQGSEIRGEVIIPSTCRYIGNYAFDGSKMSSVIFPDDLAYLGEYSFARTRIKDILIPQDIINISNGLFMECSHLKSVIIHDNVFSIGEYAFAYCHNLETFVCMAEEPPYLADNAFEGVPRDNFTIEVPPGSVEKYKRASGWKEFKRIAEYSNFVCRPATACALNSARSQTLVLNADGPWSVSHLPEWCSVLPSSGDGKTEVTLIIDALAHGSVHRADSVVFTLTDGGHKTWCEVSQYDYEYDEDEMVPLQKAVKGNGIDVVFLGDGWDGEAISNGSYMSLVQEQMEHFFGIEPYTTYRDYFNVYAGIALSQETGVNTVNTYRDTRFMTIYGGGGCNNVEPHLSVEKDDIFDYVLQHSPLQREDLPESIVILVPNSTDYGGCTYVYDDGSAISICCSSEAQYPSDTRGIIQHEAGGHGFGKLGDEMILRNMFADSETKKMIDSYHSRGWYQNVATSGKMSDVPWAHFIFDPEYSDYVDIFEGAMGFTRGVWRSEQNSCMNYGIPYYNAISRQEIMRRILDYSGEGFTMEKFYATDSKKWGSSSAQTKAMPDQAYVLNDWHTAPYVE